MVREARLEKSETGLVPAGEGWFDLNAHDARWNYRPGRQGSREDQASAPWGWFTANEVARRHGASPDENTQESDVAYAHVSGSEPSPYRDRRLPG
jgi:hypothetical protein